MGRRPITPDFYASLVEAYREKPGNASGVAKLVRLDPRSKGTCSRQTARKAWVSGWPDLEFAPIREVLEKEKLAARVALELEGPSGAIVAVAVSDDALAREQARIDAIRARTEEGKLVRIARSNVLELLTSSNELLAGYRKLAPKIKVLLEQMDAEALGVEESARLLWRIAISARASTEAGLKVLQMERLLLGQPMEIIGVRDMDDMSETDVLEELEETAAMAARIRERRERRGPRLELLQGGRTTAPGVEDVSEENGSTGPKGATNGKG